MITRVIIHRDGEHGPRVWSFNVRSPLLWLDVCSFPTAEARGNHTGASPRALSENLRAVTAHGWDVNAARLCGRDESRGVAEVVVDA